MTTQELILGHFERALTPAEEQLLQQQLSTSPEARAMYEKHRNLDGYLNNDAMALAPSSRLDELTLAAALSVVPEVIAGGSAAWFMSGKMIATVAAVVVGGASVALFTTSGSNQDRVPVPAANAPVVRTIPETSTPITPPKAPVNEPAAVSQGTTPSVTERPATKAPAVASGQKERDAAKPKLRLPGRAGTIDHGTTTVGKPK
jgi:hypothetical protein